MRITLNDIAKVVGVTKTTVSLVLNGKAEHIPQATQDKIFETARNLGYRPNKIAKSLTNQQTKIIGLIIPDIRNSFFSDLAKGIETEAFSQNYSVFLCDSDNQHKKELHYIKALIDWGVDGIILDCAADSSAKTQESFELLNTMNIPTVLVDRNIGAKYFSTVMLDNIKGAYDATSYLIQLGYNKIGCMVGALWLDCDKERLEGYKIALKENGIPFHEDLIIEANYQFDSGAKAATALLQKGVNAIFSFNDLMAYGAIHAIENAGLSVPANISVVGFDNMFYSQLTGNKLTTVGQPANEMGKTATKLLIQEILDSKAEKQHILFEPELCIRSSTSKKEIS